MSDRSATKEFYDEFLERRMVSYLLNGNKRIDMALEFAVSEGVDTRHFLDFGCGIGYFAEQLFAKSPSSKGLAVDAGPANVAFARRLLEEHKIDVYEFDSLSEKEILEFFKPLLGSAALTSIFAIDVIEHLPTNERLGFFSGLRKLIHREGSFIITYPSPDYQRYLKRNKPEELQYIDEEIPLDVLLSELSGSGWKLKTFRSADVWLKNQYYHLHLVPEMRLDRAPGSKKKPSMFRRAVRKFNRKRRKQKVDKILWEIS